MKKLIAGIAAAVLGVGVLQAQAEDKQVVRIASDGAYPPYDTTLPDGTLSGFNVEILRAICEVQNLECVWIKQEWDGIIPGLIAGKYDAIAALTISEERKRTIAFADPIHQGKMRFFAKKGTEVDVSSEEGFGDLAVGVETGSVMQCYLEKELPGLDPKVYSAQDDAYLDLKNERIDVLLGEVLQVQAKLMESNPEFEFVGPELVSPECFGSGSGPAIRQGEEDLAETFNAGLITIRENGTYQEINAEYFDIDVYPTQ